MNFLDHWICISEEFKMQLIDADSDEVDKPLTPVRFYSLPESLLHKSSISPIRCINLEYNRINASALVYTLLQPF